MPPQKISGVLSSPYVTMGDVAAHCGISKSTVSRALSQPKKVNAKTRAMVEKTIHELGYLYNPWASSPGKPRRQVLGVMVSQLREVVYNETLTVVDTMAAAAKYEVLFAITNENEQRERDIWLRFRQYRASAMIVIGASSCTESLMEQSRAEGVPHLLLWESSERPGVNFIGVNNFQLTYQATTELLRLGHRRIALLLGGLKSTKRALERLDGYTTALREAGVSFDVKLVSFLGVLAQATSRPDLAACCQASVRGMLSLQNAPTAFLIPNGQLSINAINAIKGAGLLIPDDVSVLCLGDDNLSASMSPALCSMETNIGEMHILLSRYLQEVFHSADAIDLRHTLPTGFRWRESCGPCRH